MTAKTIMAHFKSNKKYLSETDHFLACFDQKNPQKSYSQQQEIEKYQNLFYNRDTKTQSST